MASETNSTQPQLPLQTVTVNPTLSWMNEVTSALQRSDWATLLESDGVDLLDIMQNDIRIALLNLSRNAANIKTTEGGFNWRRVRKRLQLMGYRAKWKLGELRAVGESEPPRPAQVVFWPRTLSHVVSHIPVAKALQTRGISSQVITCNLTTFRDMKKHGIPSLFAASLWRREIASARRRGDREARGLKRMSDPELPTAPFDCSSEQVIAELRRTITSGLQLAHESLTNAWQIIAHYNPSLLVVGYDLTAEGRAGCLKAHQIGIPTASLMHGSVSGDPIHKYFIADRVLVYGESSRRELIEGGVSAERVVACGAPYLDIQPKQSGRTNLALTAKLGLNDDEPWVLVATSGPGHSVSHQHHQQVIENLVRLSVRNPATHFVVKLHRKDRLEYYNEAMQKHGSDKFHVIRDEQAGFPNTFFEWLQGCSLLITGASSAAIEAMLLKVPVVSMDFAEELHGINFIEMGATAHVRSYTELEERVGELLQSSDLRAQAREKTAPFLREMFFALDGRSAERAAEALIELSPNLQQ